MVAVAAGIAAVAPDVVAAVAATVGAVVVPPVPPVIWPSFYGNFVVLQVEEVAGAAEKF